MYAERLCNAELGFGSEISEIRFLLVTEHVQFSHDVASFHLETTSRLVPKRPGEKEILHTEEGCRSRPQ